MNILLIMLDLYFYTRTSLTTYLFLLSLTNSKDAKLSLICLLGESFWLIKSYFVFPLVIISCYLLNKLLKIPNINLTNYIYRLIINILFYIFLSYIFWQSIPNLSGILLTLFLALFCYKKTLA